MSFNAALAFVQRWEGGWVDDPHDPGGVTKWGITIRTLLANGLDMNNDGIVNRKDIIDMTPEQAGKIYYRDYWLAAACPRLPSPLALPVYDCAVNQGVKRASRILQKSVGANVDGIIGSQTIAAVNLHWKRDPTRLLGEFCARRAVHYSSLSQILRYGLGWFRRLFDAHGVAMKMHMEA